MRVEAGERVVVVGASGAGKTTLAKLVAGWDRPWRGQVRIAGQPIEDIDPAVRPRLVAVVAQEPHTFARTVADNVRLGRPDATDAQVRRPGGGRGPGMGRCPTRGRADRGRRRGSSPQPVRAQQLALARLVCADPAGVVLDEATAELAPAAAARTERHLHAALAGRTVITVAHRLDAAAAADRVVVIEAGTVVATGSHPELLATGGAYARLWDHWCADRSAT